MVDGIMALASSEDDRRINRGVGNPLAPDLEKRFLRLVNSLHKPLFSHFNDERVTRVGGNVTAGLNSAGIDSLTLPALRATYIHCDLRHSKECNLYGGIDGLHQMGNDSDGFVRGEGGEGTNQETDVTPYGRLEKDVL